jgi:hypothetical protein
VNPSLAERKPKKKTNPSLPLLIVALLGRDPSLIFILKVEAGSCYRYAIACFFILLANFVGPAKASKGVGYVSLRKAYATRREAQGASRDPEAASRKRRRDPISNWSAGGLRLLTPDLGPGIEGCFAI